MIFLGICIQMLFNNPHIEARKMNKNILITFITGLFFVTLSANASSPSSDGTELYIISPTQGETVTSPVTVKFGLRGMGVAPAGVEKKGTGHHHLIIDGDLPEMGKPMGQNVKHFGGGQTETSIDLAAGTHTLQLILGDHQHVPHEPPVYSKKIEIIVK